MIPPACNLLAACTICAVLAPFQSWESTDHSTCANPSPDAVEATVALVSP